VRRRTLGKRTLGHEIMLAAEPTRDGEGADIAGLRNLDRDQHNPLSSVPRLLTTAPCRTRSGCSRTATCDRERRVDSRTTARELPISESMAGVNTRTSRPGRPRASLARGRKSNGPMLKGELRITAVDKMARTDDICEKDLSNGQRPLHAVRHAYYIVNTGSGPMRFLRCSAAIEMPTYRSFSGSRKHRTFCGRCPFEDRLRSRFLFVDGSLGGTIQWSI
jgi:hypothetical protein